MTPKGILNERQIEALRIIQCGFVHLALSPIEGVQVAAEIAKSAAEEMGDHAYFAMAIEISRVCPKVSFRFVETGPHDAKPKPPR